MSVTEVRFSVPGEPVAWQRVGWRKGRSHTSPEQAVAKDAVGWSYRAAGGQLVRDLDVHLSLRFFLGGRTSAARLDPRDIDNLEKLVLDALQGVAYKNDRAVVQVWKRKYIDKGRPRTDIIVRFGDR